MFWDQECRYDRLVFKIDHMQDRVCVMYNKSNAARQMAWSQPKENNKTDCTITTQHIEY